MFSKHSHWCAEFITEKMFSFCKNYLDRKCAIVFRNQNAAITLDTPSYFNKHGRAESAIVPEIVTGEMQTVEFAKTPLSKHGLKGVLVYRMKCQQNIDDADVVSIAIMWNIPPASKPGKSGTFAVGLSSELVAGEELYKLMAGGSADWFQRKTTDTYKTEICIGSEKMYISATLSDSNFAFLSVLIK